MNIGKGVKLKNQKGKKAVVQIQLSHTCSHTFGISAQKQESDFK